MPSHNHFNTTNDSLVMMDKAPDLLSGAGAADGGSSWEWNKGVHSQGGSGSHYHSITRSSTTTGNTGSGTSVNVLNPYYVVYIWTRTN